jgi:hypothetical protein
VFRVPGHVPQFADASTTLRPRQSSQPKKSGGPGGGGSLGYFSLLKKCKTSGRNPDHLAPVKIFLRDESAIFRILPNGKSRAGRAPNVDYFLVGSVAGRQPFEEIEDQCVHNCIGHRLFPVLFVQDSRQFEIVDFKFEIENLNTIAAAFF